MYTFLLLSAGIASGACGESPEPFDSEDDGAPGICATSGGTCTEQPEHICGPGAQPLTADDAASTECDGHCCVAVESNICTDRLDTNCVPEMCTGRWQTVVNGEHLCSPGRVCCYWQQ